MEEVKDVYVYLEGLGTPEATAAKEVLKGHHKSMADRDAAARIMENTTIPSLKSQIQEAEQSVQGYVDGNASKDSQLQQALESIKDLQGKFDAKEKAEQVLTEENAFIKTSGDILSQAEANGINRSAFVDTASGRIKAGTLSIEGGEVKMTDGATEHKGAAVWETLKANNPWLVASKEGTASKAPSVAEPKTDISKMEAADLFAREYK